jgi:hypothetical protein
MVRTKFLRLIGMENVLYVRLNGYIAKHQTGAPFLRPVAVIEANVSTVMAYRTRQLPIEW